MLLSFSVSLAFFNHAPHLGFGAARLPAAAVSAGADARAAAPATRAPHTRGPAAAAPARARALAGARRGVPDRLSHRAERDRLERHRRRLRGRDRRQQDRRRTSRCTATIRPTTNTATPTARSTTRHTCRSSRSSAGAARGTTCPPRTRRRSSSTCSRSALLFLIGRRMRGPTLGIALAYAWAAYPFTLFALESNSNDTLVAVLVLAAVLAASYRSKLAPAARGGVCGAGRPDQVRPAGARADAGNPRAAPSCRSPAGSAPWRCSCRVRGRRSRSPRSPRSATTRCTRSTSARSSTSPSATRRSRSGGSTAGTGSSASSRSPPSCRRIALAVVPPPLRPRRPGGRLRGGHARRRSSASNTGSTCTSRGSSRS